MSEERRLLAKVVGQALSGRGAHVDTQGALGGLGWELAGSRPADAPFTIFQLVNHLVYWQDFSLQWLDGNKPPTPEHAADSWPGDESPKSAEEWQLTVERFSDGLEDLQRRASSEDLFSDRGGKTGLEILQLIATHNSYHVAQVAQLRRMLGSWPPPAGGATW